MMWHFSWSLPNKHVLFHLEIKLCKLELNHRISLKHGFTFTFLKPMIISIDNHFAVLLCVFHFLYKLHFACINVYPVLFACCVGALCVFVLHCACVCVRMHVCP